MSTGGRASSSCSTGGAESHVSRPEVRFSASSPEEGGVTRLSALVGAVVAAREPVSGRDGHRRAPALRL